MAHSVPRVKLQFSQVELKVGPTLAHGMMPLGRKIKIVTKRDISGIMGKKINENKTTGNRCLLKQKGNQNVKEGEKMQKVRFLRF